MSATAPGTCRHEHLTVTFDLHAETIKVACSVCYGTWPEPDTPPDLMHAALTGAKELIRSRILQDYRQGDW
ncbi:MAG: hypothetical protein ACRDNF_25645 [Streptosporangiaceae bacterium]